MAKSTSTTSTPAKRATASLRPEDMISGGLPDDFDGEVKKARFFPWYVQNMKQTGHPGYALALKLIIEPDEDSGLTDDVTAIYSAGDLTAFVPTMDGITPAGGTVDDYLELAQGGSFPEDEAEQYEGVEAMPVGKREGLANNSNMAHFIVTAIEAGFPANSISNDVRCFEGVRGHWNRLEQKTRKGLENNTGGERKGDGRILLLTEVQKITKKTTSKPVAASSPAAAAKRSSKPAVEELEEDVTETSASNGDSDFNEELSTAIVELLSDNDNSLTRGKLIPLVMRKFTGPQKALAMKQAGDVTFLSSSDLWEYDEASKTLTLAE